MNEEVVQRRHVLRKISVWLAWPTMKFGKKKYRIWLGDFSVLEVELSTDWTFVVLVG
jgi:hypothetical protein